MADPKKSLRSLASLPAHAGWWNLLAIAALIACEAVTGTWYHAAKVAVFTLFGLGLGVKAGIRWCSAVLKGERHVH